MSFVEAAALCVVLATIVIVICALAALFFRDLYYRLQQIDTRVAHLEPAECRVCGCTDAEACWPSGCWWVAPDLCSACDPYPEYSPLDRRDGLGTHRPKAARSSFEDEG